MFLGAYVKFSLSVTGLCRVLALSSALFVEEVRHTIKLETDKVCIYIYVCVYVCVYIFKYTYYICVYMCVCVCVNIYKGGGLKQRCVERASISWRPLQICPA
jgi:hypothetical protein